MREVRRVLRDDGTCWLNLGDSYASTGRSDRKESPGVGAKQEMKAPGRTLRWQAGGGSNFSWSIPSFGTFLKPKDLVGIPWRVAFALQADGWWLRSDIIWAKPNPMPESVRDRPTKAHEYVFLLTKSKTYYYDADAVREQSTGQSGAAANFKRETKDHVIPRQSVAQHRADRKPTQDTGTRNRRTIWHIATKPFSGAHFAVFPPDLIEPCILAGTSARGCCPECGAPWERMVDKTTRFEGGSGKAGRSAEWVNERGKWSVIDDGNKNIKLGPVVDTTTVGWQPTCAHDTEPTRAIVLDPFMGAGTTALVALEHNRDYVGIELNPDYIEIAERRLAEVTGVQLPLPATARV